MKDRLAVSNAFHSYRHRPRRRWSRRRAGAVLLLLAVAAWLAVIAIGVLLFFTLRPLVDAALS